MKVEVEYDKIIIILCTSCGSRGNSYMGFYKNILCSGLLHSNIRLDPRHPDLGKGILAVTNDFQICKHCLSGGVESDILIL